MTVASLAPGRNRAPDIAARWDPDGALFLTVRTAWDALLAELRLPTGEALVSAVNIPDMFDLLEHHGLRPVPVDIDPATLAPYPARSRRGSASARAWSWLRICWALASTWTRFIASSTRPEPSFP